MTAHAGKGMEGNTYLLLSSHYGNQWQFLGKLGLHLPLDTAITHVDIYPKDASSYYRDTCSSMFLAALFPIARNWEDLVFPSTEKLRKYDM